MRQIRSIIISALAACVGCAYLPSVGPDYKAPADDPSEVLTLPDAGAATTNLTETGEYRPAASNDDVRAVITTGVLQEWWKQFDDPILAGLVADATTNSLTFQMALARLDRANWELLGSYAAFLPKFDAAGNWSRRWYDKHAPDGGLTHNDYNRQQVALDGNWEIDVFGGSRRATEAAFARAQAAGWSVADAYVALVSDIAANYMSLRTTQARIDVARTNLILQTETFDILKSRLDSGIGDELAVNQCAYVVEQTRARLPEMLTQEESLKNALAILVGAFPGALDARLAPLAEPRDWLIAPQRIAELPLDLLRARPDVRVAERELAAQVASIGVAKSAWFPKLSLNGSIGYQSKNSVNLFDRDSFFATLGPSVSWPIFQGGAIYANVKATEAATREAALGYELALEGAYRDVRDAYAAYTQEYHRCQSLAAAVKAATDAVIISQDLYKNGLKDFNNVLDAQRSRLQLEESYVVSRGQITQHLITLYAALGGGLAQTN